MVPSPASAEPIPVTTVVELVSVVSRVLVVRRSMLLCVLVAGVGGANADGPLATVDYVTAVMFLVNGALLGPIRCIGTVRLVLLVLLAPRIMSARARGVVTIRFVRWRRLVLRVW